MNLVLPSGQFIWNVKPYFLEEKKRMSSATTLLCALRVRSLHCLLQNVKLLTFTTVLAYFQQLTNWWRFSYFSQETGFHISCKLSPWERMCRKCQILFSGDNEKMKKISKCFLLKFCTSMLSIKCAAQMCCSSQSLCVWNLCTCRAQLAFVLTLCS